MKTERLTEHCQELKKELEGLLRHHQNGRDKNTSTSQPLLFSKKDFINGLLTAQHISRKYITEMFGPQSEWNKTTAPLLEEFFSYEEIDNSEGIFVGYYEAVGDGIFAATKEVDKRFRDEIFMKGRRWSLPERKREFYKHLRRVAGLLGTKKYPLDFWKSHPIKRYLEVIALTPSVTDPVNGSRVCMPHISDTAAKNWIPHLPLCAALWKAIYEGKNKAADLKPEEFEAAKQEFNSVNAQLEQPFKQHLLAAGWQESDLNDVNLFDLITLYHCYDAPYTVHVFSCTGSGSQPGQSNTVVKPETTESIADSDVNNRQDITTANGASIVPKSVVALTRAQPSSPLSNSEQKLFADFSNVVGLLHDIEHVLAEKREASVHLFWQVERAYLKEVPRYRRLIESLKLILSAACEEAGIEIQSIGGRPKDAESLFTKLCDWANDSKRTEKGPSKSDWYKATLSVNLDFIVGNMPDIAGVRIVCVYDSDIMRVRDIINGLIPKDLKKRKDWTEHKVYEEGEDGILVRGYRAWHLDVTLGEERLKLVECRGLDELICEIQLKSAVGQAWSEAAHPIMYKPRLPEEVVRKEDGLQYNMMNAAATLQCADNSINAAKASYDKLTGG